MAILGSTIKQEMGSGTASDIEEHFFHDGDAFYKANVKIGEHTYKLKVLPDGTLLKMKLKENEHRDHEEGDHGDAEHDYGEHGDHDHADRDHGDHGDHGEHGHADKDHGDRGDSD